MNNKLNKFAKGMFAIFAIKMLLFSIAFIVQSCQNSEIFESEETTQARESFKNSAIVGMSNLNKINVTKNNFINSTSNRSSNNFAQIKVYKKEGVTFNANPPIELSSELADLIAIENTDLGVSYIDGTESDNISDNQELLGIYNISVQAAQNSLLPTLNEAKNYLRSKGLTDTDIQNLITADEDGPAMSESNLIPVVMQLIAEEQRRGSLTKVNFSLMFGTSAYASQIGECAGDALGVSAIAAVLNEGLSSAVGKKLLKKAIRRVASRALGWVGAAIFVYEFGDCMGWW